MKVGFEQKKREREGNEDTKMIGGGGNLGNVDTKNVGGEGVYFDALGATLGAGRGCQRSRRRTGLWVDCRGLYEAVTAESRVLTSLIEMKWAL